MRCSTAYPSNRGCTSSTPTPRRMPRPRSRPVSTAAQSSPRSRGTTCGRRSSTPRSRARTGSSFSATSSPRQHGLRAHLPPPADRLDLYPAIDLRGGRVVQLVGGDFDRETVHGDDPVAVARAFEAAGARWIHVVDLDAARTGEPRNRTFVAAVAQAVAIPVQASGGVRSLEAAIELADAGVARVVLGTAVVEDPDLVARVAARQPVAVGLDVRGREVAVRGWEAGTGVDVLDALRRIEDAGAD